MCKVILCLVYVFVMLSCGAGKELDEDFINQEIRNELSSIFQFNVDVNSSLHSDTLEINISNLPKFRTGKEYNLLLISYVFKKAHSQSGEFKIVNKYNIKVAHGGGVNYNLTLDKINSTSVLNDYENSSFLELHRTLLEELNDSITAYYDLSMNEARKIYPDVQIGESFIELISKSFFRDNRKLYTRKKRQLLEFEMRLFHWVSEFQFGSLKINKDDLNQILKRAKFSNIDEWSADELDVFYNKIGGHVILK